MASLVAGFRQGLKEAGFVEGQNLAIIPGGFQAGNERIDHLRVRMLGLSFLMLFIELALIRWTGSNILYLSYFSNFILLASFLGIGLGFLRADAPGDRFRFAPLALVVLIAFVRIFPVQIDRSGTELIFFGALGTQSGLPPWLTLPVLFLGVAGIMMLIGEGVDVAALDRIKAPAGLDLGAITPEEIAMSILAEITVERRRGQRGAGKLQVA